MADDPWGDVTAANSSGGGLGSSGVHPKAAGGPLDQAVAGVDGTTLRRAREVRHAGPAPLPALHTPCTRIERARAVARSACGAITRAAVVALPRPLFPLPSPPPEGLRSCARRAATPRIHAWHVDARVVCVCCPHSDGAQRLALVVVPSSHRCSRGVWHTRARCGRLRAQRGDAGAVSLYAALAARARGIIRVELSSKALRGLVF